MVVGRIGAPFSILFLEKKIRPTASIPTAFCSQFLVLGVPTVHVQRKVRKKERKKGIPHPPLEIAPILFFRGKEGAQSAVPLFFLPKKRREEGKGFGLGLEGTETMGNESFDHFLTVRGRLFGLLQHGRYRKRFLFLAFLLPKKETRFLSFFLHRDNLWQVGCRLGVAGARLGTTSPPGLGYVGVGGS